MDSLAGDGPGHDADQRIGLLVHDLRTPLATIAGFAELLDRRAAQLTDGQRAEYVTRIREACQQMSAILDGARERAGTPER